MENIPFADVIFARSRAAANRPLVLIEPSYRINGEEKNKTSARAVRNGENVPKVDAVSTPNSEADTAAGSTSSLDPKIGQKSVAMSSSEANSSSMALADTPTGNLVSDHSDESNSEMLHHKNESTGDAVKETMELNSKDLTPSRESGSGKPDISSAASRAKQDGGKGVVSPSIPRPPLEENIVLGVALEGSKRTLPIEEEVAPSPSVAESKELTARRNGSESPPISKDKKEGQMPAIPSSSQSD